MNPSFAKLSKILAEWGIVPRRGFASGRDWRVRLSLPRPDGTNLPVGTLSEEPQGFVFVYATEFRKADLPPVPGFPDVTKKYECETLFPFFQLRLPPTDRADVARVLQEKRIDEHDVFAMLRTLGTKVAASPYQVE